MYSLSDRSPSWLVAKVAARRILDLGVHPVESFLYPSWDCGLGECIDHWGLYSASGFNGMRIRNSVPGWRA